MAIGDAVAVFLGPATENRQPAAGVEEQISAIAKIAVNDGINMYNGTNVATIMRPSVKTDGPNDASADDFNGPIFNTAFMITNAIYLRKDGTTDRLYVGGVQTNV